ncbi:decapping endonuclease targeting mRNA [Tilletia horrida]|uniref:Decapping nuclease n=1 Tax=Tilletia horrida TaxID=155126 RepID=A0AAN6JQ98_9BASI|nr:decapping endonuclease targeting mRNA [Tilletia horrida]KAK0568959.1 decapping endonuclease targeting mRNA [Tilletia horrida]
MKRTSQPESAPREPPLKKVQLTSDPADPSIFNQPAPSTTASTSRNLELSTLTVPSPAIWSASAPLFQKPACIATFSYDESRTLHHDNRRLNIYHPPPPAVFDPRANRGRGQMRGPDLNFEYDKWCRRDETVDEHLDSLLFSLQQKAESGPVEADRDRARADVVTWRGIATKLCMSVFADSPQDEWELNVMRVGKTLYLEEYVSRAERQRKWHSTEQRLLSFQYQGYAFESWCTSPALPNQGSGGDSVPGHAAAINARDPPGWGGTVNTNVQWCAVCKTTLGSHRLIIGGEVDCVSRISQNSSTSLHRSLIEPDTFIELKTTAEIRGDRDAERLEGNKMLRFYYQSFLLGVPTIVLGFRDRDGYLVDVQEIKTLNLPRIVRNRRHHAEASKGLAFADQSLAWISNSITQDGQTVGGSLPDAQEAEKSYPVYRVTFSPTSGGLHNTGTSRLAIRRLRDEEVLDEIKGGTAEGRVGFLPLSYYSFVRQAPSPS